jgi:hypothetical protein
MCSRLILFSEKVRRLRETGIARKVPKIADNSLEKMRYAKSETV